MRRGKGREGNGGSDAAAADVAVAVAADEHTVRRGECRSCKS